LNLIKNCGASVLFTTHRLDEAEYLCTRVAIMQRGKILYDGNIEDIKSSFQKGQIAGATSTGKVLYQGLILVKHPKVDLSQRLEYLELDQEDADQALYKILSQPSKSEHDSDVAAQSLIPLSRIFRDLTDLKNSEANLISDFSYFEPSLHHAFVAISSEQKKDKP